MLVSVWPSWHRDSAVPCYRYNYGSVCLSVFLSLFQPSCLSIFSVSMPAVGCLLVPPSVRPAPCLSVRLLTCLFDRLSEGKQINTELTALRDQNTQKVRKRASCLIVCLSVCQTVSVCLLGLVCMVSVSGHPVHLTAQFRYSPLVVFVSPVMRDYLH